jgi:hypothetical protein
MALGLIASSIVTTAEAAASSAIDKAIKSASSGDMSGSIENESFIEWILWNTHCGTGTPNPGLSVSTLEALPAPQDEYDAWKMSGGPLPKNLPKKVEDLDGAQSILLERWIKSVEITGKTWDTFLLQNHIEYTATYHDKDKKYGLAIVVVNPQVGGKWCGVISTSYDWMHKSDIATFAKHVKSVGDDSSFTKIAWEGKKMTANKGMIKLTVNCGRKSTFTIGQTHDPKD